MKTSDMSKITQNSLWIDLFREFENLPELWMLHSDIFKDRKRKRQAWYKLLKVYKAIVPKANVKTLKRKINSLRSSFRRELNKVEESERNESIPYIPKLWYFPQLQFLREPCARRISFPSNSPIYPPPESYGDVESVSSAMKSPKRRHYEAFSEDVEQQEDQVDNEVFNQAPGTAQADVIPRDDGIVYADSWALTFNKLDETQKIFAKKAIDDILTLGQLNMLNYKTVQNISLQANNALAELEETVMVEQYLN